MKGLFSVLILVFSFFAAYAQPEKKITILHTNDLHSRLTGFGPEANYSPLETNNDNTIGGFARVASIIKSEKEIAPGIFLVVDAGDFLMGTLFQSLEVKTGFQLRVMKEMGYDLVCIGNHEFDYGPDKLAEIISNSENGGAIPELLLSNAVFDKDDSADNSLEELYDSGIIGRKYIIERGGLKIGFFSILGKVADSNAAFAPPVTFAKQIPAAKKIVRELRDEKCDLVICLSHSGLTKDKNGNWVGEDYDLAKKVDGIDVIVSGHTHTVLSAPVIEKNIPIVQTGSYGHFVGKLSLTYESGKVKVDDYTLVPVDDKIAGDRKINDIIQQQKEIISTEILKPLNLSYNTPVAETDFPLICDEMGDIEGSNLGPMVAEAIYQYVNNHNADGTDVSMVAVGVIRDMVVPGLQAAPDIFRIMSMGTGNDSVPGYPLSRLFVTGKELKSILEILQVAYKSAPENYCYYAGLRVEYDPDGGLLRKIKKIEIRQSDGSFVNADFSKRNQTLYSVTANSYMLEFFSIIKKMSFGLINVVPKDINGNRVSDMKVAVIDMNNVKEGIQEGKEWLALIELLSSMNDTNGNGIPDIDKKYSVPVKCFFPVSLK